MRKKNEIIKNQGIGNLIIAVTVYLLTAVIKIPIKRLAAKAEDSKKYTKYITFLPVILGFGATVLYECITAGKIVFSDQFISLWLTSASLSLALYAFTEKFFPSKEKILSEQEIKTNKELIEKIENYFSDKPEEEMENSDLDASEEKNESILTGETETISSCCDDKNADSLKEPDNKSQFLSGGTLTSENIARVNISREKNNSEIVADDVKKSDSKDAPEKDVSEQVEPMEEKVKILLRGKINV